jgi:hypothetical protein
MTPREPWGEESTTRVIGRGQSGRARTRDTAAAAVDTPDNYTTLRPKHGDLAFDRSRLTAEHVGVSWFRVRRRHR